ncbi:MAG: biotin/lipoyl-containing protein, partial [bacterium]
EHPVTEMVTGLDLVELQLRIAAGEPLPMRQDEVTFSGHAIEFRINAEDPWDNFKPSSGRIDVAYWGDFDRSDYGYTSGDVIPSNYDSLAGKIVKQGDTREEALSFAAHELERSVYLRPLRTNALLLHAIQKREDFRSGAAGINWLEQNLSDLLLAAPPTDEACAAAAVAATLDAPRSSTASAQLWLDDGIRVRECAVRRSGNVFAVSVDGTSTGGPISAFQNVTEYTHRVEVVCHGYRYGFGVSEHQIFGGPHDAGQSGLSFEIVPPPPLPRRAHAALAGATAITAPLSGTIAAVQVAEGDTVAEGQVLLVLEAMKMEHRITAPASGVVKRVNVRERDQVREGDILVELA